jgi:hypothetical protein
MASDHDFQPEMTLTPLGILLPQTANNFWWFGPGKVTAGYTSRLYHVRGEL